MCRTPPGDRAARREIRIVRSPIRGAARWPRHWTFQSIMVARLSLLASLWNTSPEQHIRNGLGQDQDIQPEGAAADVLHIERLPPFPGNFVAARDLGQAGEARFH